MVHGSFATFKNIRCDKFRELHSQFIRATGGRKLFRGLKLVTEVIGILLRMVAR